MTIFGDDNGGTLACSQNRDLVLALGVISAPDYHGRRMAQRHSWMRWPNVGHGDGHTVCGSFVVRAGDAPRGVATALLREADVHGDMLLARSIAFNESRVRGPIMSLAWWLLYAEHALPHAQFIGKLDDDAYLHSPDLERLLRLSHMQLGPSANVYIGVLTWYHWYEKLFDNTRHAWNYKQAVGVGAWCRRNPLRVAGACGASPGEMGECGACVGPFAFAAGYLVVGSRALIHGLVATGGVASEARRLRAIRPSALLNKQGLPLEQV